MAIKNKTLTVNFLAWDTGNNVGKTGDSGNFTMRLIKDGGVPAAPDNSVSEPDSTNMPGLYELVLTATEMNANFVSLHGKSSTSDIVIYPIFITTEQGQLDTLYTTRIPNIISLANINSEVDTALTDYDGPTKAEMDSGFAALNDLSAAQVNTEVDTALSDIRLNEVMSASLGSQPTAGSLFGDLTEDDAGTQRFTANALEQAPSSGDATAANQTTIINHLTDVKGTGFVKDTHSLTDILTDVTGLNGSAMRGTDSALLASSAPTNFGDLAITVTTGKITVGTNDDKTGYNISGTKQTLDALNDISTSQVNTECDTALTDYDPPTKTEMDAGFAALNNLSAAQVNTEVDTALSDIRLNELMSASLGSQPTAGSLFGDLTEDDSGTQRFTANALEQAPTVGRDMYLEKDKTIKVKNSTSCYIEVLFSDLSGSQNEQGLYRGCRIVIEILTGVYTGQKFVYKVKDSVASGSNHRLYVINDEIGASLFDFDKITVDTDKVSILIADGTDEIDKSEGYSFSDLRVVVGKSNPANVISRIYGAMHHNNNDLTATGGWRILNNAQDSATDPTTTAFTVNLLWNPGSGMKGSGKPFMGMEVKFMELNSSSDSDLEGISRVVTNMAQDGTYTRITIDTALPSIPVRVADSDLTDRIATVWSTQSGAGSTLTSQNVRDAMKLAPTGGAPATGSVDTHLDDILTDTGTTIPAQITSNHSITDALITSSHATTDAILNHGTYGLSALKTEIDANETKIDTNTTHLTDIKGTGFVKDTDSLIDLSHKAGTKGTDAIFDNIGALSIPTAAAIADAVLEEKISDHESVVGSFAWYQNYMGASLWRKRDYAYSGGIRIQRLYARNNSAVLTTLNMKNLAGADITTNWPSDPAVLGRVGVKEA